MTVEEVVLERLRTDTGVNAIASTRVYQLILPQSPTLPAIRVQAIDEISRYHLRGGVTLLESRVQTDVYAAPAAGTDVYRVAADLAIAVHASLNAQRWTADDTDVVFVRRVDRRALWEGGDIQAARILQDWIVWTSTRDETDETIDAPAPPTAVELTA